jgi:hypothetical protein
LSGLNVEAYLALRSGTEVAYDRAINAGDGIALYGAVVATAVAVFGGWARYRDRPAVRVSGSLIRNSASPSQADDLRGTLHEVERGNVRLCEEVLVGVHVLNSGRRAVQVTAALIETKDANKIGVMEVVPEPLPTLVEPLTSVDITFQKEFIDNTSAVTFIGVV